MENTFESIHTFFDEEKQSESRFQLSEKDKIEDIVCEILETYGPDGHTDGSNLITNFIVKLLQATPQQRQSLLKSTNLNDFI